MPQGDVVHAGLGREHKYRTKVEMGLEQEPQRIKMVTSTLGRNALLKSLPKAKK